MSKVKQFNTDIDLLQNHINNMVVGWSTSPPVNPVFGQMYYLPPTGQAIGGLFIWNGAWVNLIQLVDSTVATLQKVTTAGATTSNSITIAVTGSKVGLVATALNGDGVYSTSYNGRGAFIHSTANIGLVSSIGDTNVLNIIEAKKGNNVVANITHDGYLEAKGIKIKGQQPVGYVLSDGTVSLNQIGSSSGNSYFPAGW